MGTFFGRKCNLLFYNILTAPFSTPCWKAPRTADAHVEAREQMRAAPSALDGGNTHQYLDQTTAFFIACRFLRGARTQVELSAVCARALKRVLAVGPPFCSCSADEPSPGSAAALAQMTAREHVHGCSCSMADRAHVRSRPRSAEISGPAAALALLLALRFPVMPP